MVSEDKRVHEITNKQYQYACVSFRKTNRLIGMYGESFKTGKTPESNVSQGKKKKKAFSGLENT